MDGVIDASHGESFLHGADFDFALIDLGLESLDVFGVFGDDE